MHKRHAMAALAACLLCVPGMGGVAAQELSNRHHVTGCADETARPELRADSHEVGGPDATLNPRESEIVVLEGTLRRRGVEGTGVLTSRDAAEEPDPCAVTPDRFLDK